MNKEDADSVLEAVVLMNQTRQHRYEGPSAEYLRDERPVYDERSKNIRLAVERNEVFAKADAARKKLRHLYCMQHHLIAGSQAALVTLVALIREMPEQKDETLESVFQIMRDAYDADIERLLDSKTLTFDPREEGALWKGPTRAWYAALQTRTGRGPALEVDLAASTELEQLRKDAEAGVQRLEIRQYGKSEREQRQSRFDVARAESLRICAETLKLQATLEDTRVKLVRAVYRSFDLNAAVRAILTAQSVFLKVEANRRQMPLDELTAEIRVAMRRVYDIVIDEALVSKRVLDDPRKDASLWTVAASEWFGTGGWPESADKPRPSGR